MLRIGIVGSGFGMVGLLPAFRSIKGCQVVAVCVRKPIHVVPKVNNIYSDWQLFLEDKNLDAVALAVPPGLQYQIAKRAIIRELHVFAEKPLAANLSQAKELFTLARKHKIIHGVDFIFPEIAEWKRVKKILDQKKYGKLKHISVNWNFLSGDIKNKRSSWKTNIVEGGGVLAFYFSHGLYYLEHFAGEIIETRSLFTHSLENLNGGEVCSDILLRFKGGIIGNAHVSCISRGLIRHQLIFQCEEGVIVLENKNSIVDNFTITVHSENGSKQIFVNKDKNKKNSDERVKVVTKIAKRFVLACRHNRQMTPSFKEGLHVQELIEKIRNESI